MTGETILRKYWQDFSTKESGILRAKVSSNREDDDECGAVKCSGSHQVTHAPLLGRKSPEKIGDVFGSGLR
jgi:hypothetical protein